MFGKWGLGEPGVQGVKMVIKHVILIYIFFRQTFEEDPSIDQYKYV